MMTTTTTTTTKKKSVPSCLLLLLLLLLFSLESVIGHPSSFLQGVNNLKQELEFRSAYGAEQQAREDEFASWRKEAARKIQEVLGIQTQNESPTQSKEPPQYMMELYSSIAYPSGITRKQKPYNAKIVRSFVEQGLEPSSSMSQFYYFNISGLGMNETVMEAELHLYRRKNLGDTCNSICHMTSVYQVLDKESLDVPEKHRLLVDNCVSTYGWHVFNVKSAVTAWTKNNEPNLGLLVVAKKWFSNRWTTDMFTRDSYNHNKQPILVLFTDDKKDKFYFSSDFSYYSYGPKETVDPAKERAFVRKKQAKDAKLDDPDGDRNSSDANRERASSRLRELIFGQPEEVQLESNPGSELFERQKRLFDGNSAKDVKSNCSERKDNTWKSWRERRRRRRDTASSKRHSSRIVSSRDARIAKVLTSMDIYERAAFRKRLSQIDHDGSARRSIVRERRSTMTADDETTMPEQQNNTGVECGRRELYIDFKDIGLSSYIIAPQGYSAFQCKGVCEPPLSQDQRPTNHATIQAIVHKMGMNGVGKPCCVPTKLVSTSFLLYENENVVLKTYEDMAVESCGCR